MSTILIVDDNPVHMELAKIILEQHGYSILQAADADSARHLARTRMPDLVLMDVDLAGYNGLDVVRELKMDPVTCAIPFIAMTAYLSEHPRHDAIGFGCASYIAKPYHYNELLQVVKEVLGES